MAPTHHLNTTVPDLPVTEGTVALDVPSAGVPCHTWYKVVGDLANRTHTPLVILHGGPGMTHTYLSALLPLARTRPLVFYDQLGNGRSTHLPAAFWAAADYDAVFLAELAALLAHLRITDGYALLGHSWGGMLAARHATRAPPGLRALVVADSPADMGLWAAAQAGLRAQLPPAVLATLEEHEAARTYDAPEYVAATDVFDHLFCCRLPEWPEAVVSSMRDIEADPTVYHTLNGPNDFTVTGPLRHWTLLDPPVIPQIRAPTLLLNGAHDGAQDATMAPFFAGIARVKWVTFAESSHMPHVEETEKYLRVVGDFLETVGA
ncbi:hypothetical protein HWV62_4661 [Athelia sp. TMB]|nr:hypothetical protein HWV62_4661 [Athelia sp. TMB]